jgi:hypothetical protein
LQNKLLDKLKTEKNKPLLKNKDKKKMSTKIKTLNKKLKTKLLKKPKKKLLPQKIKNENDQLLFKPNILNLFFVFPFS